MKKLILSLICFAPWIFLTMSVDAAEHSIGFGAHYFRTLDEISDDLEDEFGDSFHEDGVALNLSYRYKPDPLYGFLFELQTYPDGYYFAENAYSPRFIFCLGSTIYAGAGVAWNYFSAEDAFSEIIDDGEWSDAYYLIRGGLEFPLFIPALKIDINATYDFNTWHELDEFDSDLLTFGAGVRIIL